MNRERFLVRMARDIVAFHGVPWDALWDGSHRGKAIVQVRHAVFQQLWEAGASMADIAWVTDMDARTVSRALKDMGALPGSKPHKEAE
ncbi:MAG: hypothetical protein JKP92_05960 [Alphaproteobacteria bacterium]|jgi:hypothetical protein|nr:hypothetical protein [Alphaproteobacteria bacterium]